MSNKKQNRITKKQADFIVYKVQYRLSQKAAAEKVGVNEATVWRWKQDKMFLEELEKTGRNNFKYLATIGADVLESLLENGKDESIKFKAAVEALDRGFGKVTNKIEANVSLSVEDVLAAMKNNNESEEDADAE